ncbi:brain acid soluble protein 1 homolog [Salvia hispanica]|uniref:brain acid soluble protein 1 homolog n=1 Tax=Salvia hispanica TaxID=49212 RepID=UPI00200941FB|nr:brain acid soluble protein 1 homolog [Salvia hispanica]
MATEATADEAKKEEIDLNKMAKKQGLMTDDEFQAVLSKGDRIVVNPEGVAEVLDLASQAVGRGETTMEADESEGVVHQSVEEMTEEQPEKAEQLEEERQEPETHQEEAPVSNKAGANTAADAVEVSSEDEKTTPTKPGEKPSKASQKDTQMATGTVSSTPTDQKENADKVAEGLDLASESVGREEATRSDTSTRVVTEPTT